MRSTIKKIKLDTGYIRVLTTLILINYLPSIFFVQAGASSLAAGLFVAGSVTAAISYWSPDLRHIKGKLFTIFLLTSFWLIISSIYLYSTYDNPKPLTSFIFIALAAYAYIFSNTLARTEAHNLEKAVYHFILITLAFGWLGALNLSDIGKYAFHNKPVLPFSEESHYALSVGFFSCAYLFVCTPKRALLIIANLATQSIIFPSLTLLCFTAIASMLTFSRFSPKYFFVTSLGILATLLFTINYAITNIEYFSSRLSFQDSENLTTLVWLQGIDLAWLNLINTSGTGLGFQMLGSTQTILSDYSHLIYKMSGVDKNLTDGGFLAAKLISELGILGIAITFLYATYMIKFLLSLGNTKKTPPLTPNSNLKVNRKTALASALLFSFCIEFFLRGYGYFSPSLFVSMSALFYLLGRSDQHDQIQYSNVR